MNRWILFHASTLLLIVECVLSQIAEKMPKHAAARQGHDGAWRWEI